MFGRRKWKVHYDLNRPQGGWSTAIVEAASESDAAAVFRRTHDARAVIDRVVPA